VLPEVGEISKREMYSRKKVDWEGFEPPAPSILAALSCCQGGALPSCATSPYYQNNTPAYKDCGGEMSDK
jgi:hypothetical protein